MIESLFHREWVSILYPLDLAELHSFRLVYFKHKGIFLIVCIVSDEGSVSNYARLPV